MSESRASMTPHTCRECGMEMSDLGEYHPWAVCVLSKAGMSRLSIWTLLSQGSRALKAEPGQFKLVRDLP